MCRRARKIREEHGIWKCVARVVTLVVGGAAIIFSGGAATPIVLGVGTIAFGTSNAIEGEQEIYYGSVENISWRSFNQIRDTVFFGNQTTYDIAEDIVTFAAGASIPLTNAVKIGKVVTTVDKAKFIGIELSKEVVGTAGGFGGVWLGEKLGLSQDQSMFLGMIASIASSKGADWVDNNFDNLVLAGKYTFNNSGKNVTLSMNGTGTLNTFFDTFTYIKNGKIVFNSIDDVINLGINSVDDLMKLGVNSVDDLAKLKVSSIDDLAKIGIKNKNDLAKLGIDSSDLKKIGIDPKVFEAKYQVGAYQDIKGVEGLDAHHAGQKALMKKLVDGYDELTAPAINVPKIGHTKRHPVRGIVSRSTKGITNTRQLLARDIMELRRVYPDIPNSKLQELIEMNKKLYKEMRK